MLLKWSSRYEERNSEEPGRDRGSYPFFARGPQERGQGQDTVHQSDPPSDGYRASALRDRLRGLSTGLLSDTLAPTRPTGDLADPFCAAKTALRRLARRYQALQQENKEADAHVASLVIWAAPSLVALPGVGTETAG